MSSMERRMEILEVLCRRRSDTVENLANEFGVSKRTIKYDIEYLSLSYPVYTVQGNGGGIYITDGYTDEELKKKEDEILYSELSTWFDWYDMQVSQYERSKRLEITFDRDIATLDAEAVQKAEQMREVKDRLGIE